MNVISNGAKSIPLNLVEKFIFFVLSLVIILESLHVTNVLASSVISSTLTIELLYFSIAIAYISIKPSKKTTVAISLAVLFLTVLLFSNSNSTPIYESTRATKWLLYLILLYLVGDKKIINLYFLKKLLFFLIISTFISYFFQRLMLGNEIRPQLLTENNYEIALLSGLISVRYLLDSAQKSIKDFALIFFFLGILLMSGSRSGVLCGVITVTIIAIRSNSNKFNFSKVVAFVVTPLFLVALYVFGRRNQNLLEIDRLYFLRIFNSEMQLKNPVEWLFGNLSVLPITQESCYALKYYQILFADPVNLSCYSVVFHSFIIRLIFDFGIVGLILSSYLIFKRVKSTSNSNLAYSLLFIALINGTSVSGINNVYVMFPILLAVLTRKE